MIQNSIYYFAFLNASDLDWGAMSFRVILGKYLFYYFV
jgi:hypothetical protein